MPVGLDNGATVSAHAVVIATGARYRKLDVQRLDEFEGKSVYYAATPVEARMCAGDPVVVVGGGNSAAQAALFLARQAPRVCLVVRHGDIERDMSRYLAERLRRDPTIEVHVNTEVRALVGDRSLDAVAGRGRRDSGSREVLPARAVFVFIGAEPHTAWLGGEVALDEDGFVLTGPEARHEDAGGVDWPLDRAPYALETSRPGVFAVGDVRSGGVRRVASAVGEGAMAVRFVHQYLAAVGGAAQPPGVSVSRGPGPDRLTPHEASVLTQDTAASPHVAAGLAEAEGAPDAPAGGQAVLTARCGGARRAGSSTGGDTARPPPCAGTTAPRITRMRGSRHPCRGGPRGRRGPAPPGS